MSTIAAVRDTTVAGRASQIAATRKLNLSTRDVVDALRSIDEHDAAVIARFLNARSCAAIGLAVATVVAKFVDDDSETAALKEVCRDY